MGLVFGGLFVIAIAVLARKSPPSYGYLPAGRNEVAPTMTSGAALAQQWTAIDVIEMLVKAGRPVPASALGRALADCAKLGDWEGFRELAEAFGVSQQAIAHDEQSTPVESPAQETPTEPMQESGDVVKSSPIVGVSREDWSAFVQKLKTQECGYRDPRHVGMFHHSTSRLGELGIDPASLGDESTQYAALESDVRDAMERYKRLINDYAGDVIPINGQGVAVTRSGILGLLKCAGAENARSWLSDDSDRMRFPNTTAMFLKTNQIF